MADSSESQNLKKNCRSRLVEMFQKAESKGSYMKVLVMDEFTVKIISNSFTASELHDQHIFNFYGLRKIREPMPSLDTIYFIRPTEKNVTAVFHEMAIKPPLYKNAFLFFSSPLSTELKTRIKTHSILTHRIIHICELNLEYLVIDSLGFVTNNVLSFGDLAACLDEMATRIATIFVSLKEYPVVRYQAAESRNTVTVTSSRELIPTNLAARVFDCLVKYKDTNPNYPPREETCELLILDRTIDQVMIVLDQITKNKA